jgi:hypothetical protein
MRFQDVKITQQDLERILAEANPAQAASFVGDGCQVYHENRHYILAGISVLSAIYPVAASAIGAMAALIEKACEGQTE